MPQLQAAAVNKQLASKAKIIQAKVFSYRNCVGMQILHYQA